MRNIVITVRNKSDNGVVAVTEMTIPDSADDELVLGAIVEDTPLRPQRRQERNPLHPRALRLADLRVGMKIRVHYTGDCPWVQSYRAIVVGEPTVDDLGFQVIPIVTDDMEYKMGFVADMGLAPSRCGGVWNRVWYTTAE